MRPGLLTFACLCTVLPLSAAAGEFALVSPVIAPGARLPDEQVFAGYGCTGGNVSPALSWQGVPAGTQSFALTVFDPDARGAGWWHWIVVDLPAAGRSLARDAGAAGGAALPAGARQLRNSFGTAAYGGACPPPGDPAHRYRFTLHALRVSRLAVAADATPQEVAARIREAEIARTGFVAHYQR